MAKRLFEDGSYVIVDDEGVFIHYEKKLVKYEVTQDIGYRIFQDGKNETLIENGDITDWDTVETGTNAYTEATLKVFLRKYTGRCCPADDGSITGGYTELFDIITPLITGAWHVVTLPGAPANRVCGILIRAEQNNRVVGVRAVGSALNRSGDIDADSIAYLTVLSNSTGEVEIFTTSLPNVTFIVESYLF